MFRVCTRSILTQEVRQQGGLGLAGPSMRPPAFNFNRVQAMQQGQDEAAKETRDFLTFFVGGEEYGVDILMVKEIRGYEAVTNIINTPPSIIGVINLRGSIVPIIDMRIKLNLGSVDYGQYTVVIVFNLNGRLIGLVVDGVSDVVSLAAGQILPAPELGAKLDNRFIVGLGVIDNRMIILTDIARFLTADEMGPVCGTDE